MVLKNKWVGLLGFLVVVFFSHNNSFASDEALDLLLAAFRHSGENPSVIKSGKAEFDVTTLYQPSDQTIEAHKKSLQEIEKHLLDSFQGPKEVLENELEQLRANHTFAIPDRKEQISVKFLGNDARRGDNYDYQRLRLVDIKENIQDASSSLVASKKVLFAKLPHKSDSISALEWSVDSNRLNCSNRFYDSFEFQTFGRIIEAPESLFASFLAQKMNREDFSFSSATQDLFKKTLLENGLVCEISGEVSYDNQNKAFVVTIKQDEAVLETYHIDPGRGFLCPYMKIEHPSRMFTRVCISEDYLLDETSGLYYPQKHEVTSVNNDTGTTTQKFKLTPGSLEFNVIISHREFALDVPERARIFWIKTPLLDDPPSVIQGMPYTANQNGIISLADGAVDLSKYSWITPPSQHFVDDTPSPQKTNVLVRRFSIIAAAIVGIIILFINFKNKKKSAFLLAALFAILTSSCNAENIKHDLSALATQRCAMLILFFTRLSICVPLSISLFIVMHMSSIVYIDTIVSVSYVHIDVIILHWTLFCVLFFFPKIVAQYWNRSYPFHFVFLFPVNLYREWANTSMNIQNHFRYSRSGKLFILLYLFASLILYLNFTGNECYYLYITIVVLTIVLCVASNIVLLKTSCRNISNYEELIIYIFVFHALFGATIFSLCNLFLSLEYEASLASIFLTFGVIYFSSLSFLIILYRLVQLCMSVLVHLR